MKKLNLLVLSSALLLGLASCNVGTPAASSPVEQETSSVDTTDYAKLGETAIVNISASFDKWATGISTKQSLPTESKVTDNGKEYTFAITYTIASDAAAYLSISDDGTYLKVKADSEDHPLKNAVTAHASINNAEKASKSFNVKVAAKTYIDLAKVYEAAAGDEVTTRGYIEIFNKNASIITVSSGTSSIAIYTTAEKYYTDFQAGDLVEVTGKVDIYSGLYELKPSAITKVEEEDESVLAPVELNVGGKTDLDDPATIQSRKGVVEGYLKSITGAHKKNTNNGREYEMVEAVVYVGSATDGWQSITIHLESDKLTDAEFVKGWGYSYDAESKEVVWDENVKPKEGEKIKATGYMGWYNGAQLSNAKLESKSEWTGEKPSAPEYETKKTTIADLKKKTKAESDVAYEVTGIYEVSGSTKYLTDATTGESIMIYKLTAAEGKGVTWNGLDGYTYENAGEDDASLADLKAGEEVTLKALNSYYNKTSEVKANLISHKTASYTYKAGVEKAGDDAATVSLSKTEGLAYGEEVTVTATAGTENYVVDTVIVTDAAGTETDITSTMKFNATCVNKVKVTFKDGSVDLKSTTLTASAFKLTTSYGAGTAKIDGTAWSFTELMQNADTDSIQMRTKNGKSSLCYNTSALPKAIKNVVITFNTKTIYTNKSGVLVNNTGLCVIATGTSELSTGGTVSCKTADDAFVYTYTPTSTTDTYFAMSHSGSGAIYIDSIVINFVD